MKKAVLFLLVSSICFVKLNAQKVDSIFGNWKFSKLHSTDGADSIGISLMKEMFKEMTIYLKPNYHYKANLIKKEEGTFEYDVKSKKLTLSSNNGKKSSLIFENYQNETAIIGLDEKLKILLQKIPTTLEDEKEELVTKPLLVSITSAQLCKKWFFSERFVPNKSEKILKMVNEVFKGSFFDFKKDKTYNMKTGEITQTGKWSLTNENKTILLTVDNESSIWNVKKVTGNELILFKGNTEEYWTFLLKE